MKRASLGRRIFLKGTGSAAALSALGVVSPLQAAFARELRALDPDPGKRFAGLAASYDLDPGVTYLNHASIGTVPRIVRRARERYAQLCESNPWLYIWGEAWEEAVAATRRKAARLLGCRADELAITHTTTEGFNTLAHGLKLEAEGEVLFSSLNHVGASACWFHQGPRRGFHVRRFDFPVGDVAGLTAGDVVALHLEQISARTRVLVFPHIDNLVGLRHPVKDLAAAARRRGVSFIAVDGAQSVGMLPVNLTDLGVDFYATSAHKWLQAPKGLGLLYVRKSAQPHLAPLSVTWGQKLWQGSARMYEDFGTRDLDTVLALGDALDFQDALGAAGKETHFRGLWSHSRQRAEAAAGLAWRSPARWELSSSLYAVGFQSPPAPEVFEALNHPHGFVVRPFRTQGLNSLRLSPSSFNTGEEIDRFFDRLEEAIA
ncbi:MAG: aminotransferase class V-fold PLP-dependent enzyme [Acidobacteriota bacterium]